MLLQWLVWSCNTELSKQSIITLSSLNQHKNRYYKLSTFKQFLIVHNKLYVVTAFLIIGSLLATSWTGKYCQYHLMNAWIFFHLFNDEKCRKTSWLSKKKRKCKKVWAHDQWKKFPFNEVHGLWKWGWIFRLRFQSQLNEFWSICEVAIKLIEGLHGYSPLDHQWTGTFVRIFLHFQRNAPMIFPGYQTSDSASS